MHKFLWHSGLAIQKVSLGFVVTKCEVFLHSEGSVTPLVFRQ